MRITGLASGLDTDSMVRKMMKPYEMRVDKVRQDKQVLEWQQDTYRNIIKDIRGLYDKYFTSTSSESLVKALTGIDVDSENKAVVAATASAEAKSGAYKINVTQTATSAVIGSNTIANDFKLPDDVDLSINGVNIKVAKDESINSFVNKINETLTANNINVEASYSQLDNKLYIKTKDTGNSVSLEIKANNVATETVLNNMGLSLNNKVTGQNAQAEITTPDGIVHKIDKETNSFSADGVNYTLVNKGQTVLNVNQNEKMYDKVKGFIDDYNKIIDNVYQKANEKKQYKYKPLTDEQKKEMKEEDIKKWEAKAKEGILKNDPMLNSLLTNLRSSLFYFDKNNPNFSLRDLGIDTLKDSSRPGQLTIDKTKFMDTIKQRGKEATDFLIKTPDQTTLNGITDPILAREYKMKNSGVFTRIKDVLYDNAVKFDGTLVKKAGAESGIYTFKNYYSEQILNKTSIIEDMQIKLAKKEDSFYMQFAKLEKAMNEANSQSSWLTQQLGMGGAK